MNKKIIYIMVGFLISSAIVKLITRKWRDEQEAMDREVEEMTNKVVSDMLKEEHDKNMRSIQEEGDRIIAEMHDKNVKDMVNLNEKVLKISKGMHIGPSILHYKDVNGVIHEFDMNDRDEFKKVMSDKANTLIF